MKQTSPEFAKKMRQRTTKYWNEHPERKEYQREVMAGNQYARKKKKKRKNK